jgi:cytochrome c oxidase assembly protein subunit 15
MFVKLASRAAYAAGRLNWREAREVWHMTVAAIGISQRMPSLALRRFAWGVLVFFILTILWGAVVRATGSGAGCGDHWPLCNGTVFQQSPTLHTMIEFSHRVSAGAIDSILVVALIVWTFRRTVSGHLARWAASATIFLTVTEGALGAVLVKFGLTAESRSPMRAPVEALHLSNTLLLLAALAMTAHFLSRRVGYRWRDIRISAPIGTTIGMIAVMIVGVTGSLAALGDTLFPATSLGDSIEQDFAGHLSGESTWLLRWRWTHPTIAILASIFLIWLLIRAARRRGPWDNRRLSALVVGLLVVQYVLGALDVWLLAPVWMQVMHLLGADLLWTALVVLTARLTLLPIPAKQPK